MIIMTLVGSILLYPAGELRYIDALFFAAGSATQSGLNTYVSSTRGKHIGLIVARVDVNKLYLYQQVCDCTFNSSTLLLTCYLCR
jgi:hypothetical protein